jgi:hypothetical protein
VYRKDKWLWLHEQILSLNWRVQTHKTIIDYNKKQLKVFQNLLIVMSQVMNSDIYRLTE